MCSEVEVLLFNLLRRWTSTSCLPAERAKSFGRDDSMGLYSLAVGCEKLMIPYARDSFQILQLVAKSTLPNVLGMRRSRFQVRLGASELGSPNALFALCGVMVAANVTMMRQVG